MSRTDTVTRQWVTFIKAEQRDRAELRKIIERSPMMVETELALYYRSLREAFRGARVKGERAKVSSKAKGAQTQKQQSDQHAHDGRLGKCSGGSHKKRPRREDSEHVRRVHGPKQKGKR